MTHARTLAAAAVLLFAAPAASPAAAQSLFGTRGLGVPAAPVDARAAALGGIGIGLIGFHTSIVNPAEISGLTRRGVSAALQPVSARSTIDGEDGSTSGTRFPVMRVIYPIGDRTVATLGYGSYLEQSWATFTESEQVVAGQTMTVRDLLRSTGGIAQLRLGAAYAVSPTLAVGAAAGLLTGNTELYAGRGFVGDTTGELRTFEETRRWNYLAPIASVGVRWDVAGVFRLGASAMAGGNLEASGRTEGAGDRTYGAPLDLAAGASARVSPLLTANAAAGWSRVPATDGETVSRETARVGGGLEYQGVRSGARTYPVRVGARWLQLPYHLQGEEPPSEWAAGLGLGFRLGDPANPAALADIGFEHGRRTGLAGTAVPGGMSERLWRFTLSLSLFGN
jgi:hypothetical protein